MRIAMKTVSYGCVHLVVAISVAYALTGNWIIAVGIGLIEPFIQTFAYLAHEWVWETKRPPCKVCNEPYSIKSLIHPAAQGNKGWIKYIQGRTWNFYQM